MKKAVVKRWVKNLRSKKFKQTQGSLCRVVGGEDRFCCLGVLADEEIDGEWEYDTYNERWILVHGEAKMPGLLAPKTFGKLGMTSVEHYKFVSWNDVDGLSFEEIADRLEERYLK